MLNESKLIFRNEKYFYFVPHKNELYGYEDNKIYLFKENPNLLYEAKNEEIIYMVSKENYLLFITFSEKLNTVYIKRINVTIQNLLMQK